jgi:hypothetical protein
MKALAPICSALALFATACKQSPAPSQTAIPFEYTNIVHQGPAGAQQANVETIIKFGDEAWLGHQHEKISMGLGTNDYQAVAYFEETNHAIRRIVQQFTVGTNHFALIDRDGDGIPDERRDSDSKQADVLLRGDWRMTRGAWTNREALVNSNWLPVQFENGRWQVHATNSVAK